MSYSGAKEKKSTMNGFYRFCNKGSLRQGEDTIRTIGDSFGYIGFNLSIPRIRSLWTQHYPLLRKASAPLNLRELAPQGRGADAFYHYSISSFRHNRIINNEARHTCTMANAQQGRRSWREVPQDAMPFPQRQPQAPGKFSFTESGNTPFCNE